MASAEYNRTPAENEGLTRRNLLRAAPAVGFTALVGAAAPVEALAETPVAALYREWVIAREAENHAYDVCETEAEWNAASDARAEIESRMLATPSQCHIDWMLKVCAYAAFGESGAPDANERPELWVEARRLVGT